jgi:hypothetical protein
MIAEHIASAYKQLIAEHIAGIASAYRPWIAEHIAGVANVTADALSRLHEPGGACDRPACLSQARAAVVPARPRGWYRALAAPAGPP